MPVNYALTGPELARILRQSGTRAAFADDSLIMPTPVLSRLLAALPEIGFYNCFGQSEMGPLCTVLRPEEHEARPASAGRAIPFVDPRTAVVSCCIIAM